VKHWVALEANPDVLTKFIQRLGVPPTAEFVDIYGTDSELLALVPQPVFAVLLLFPVHASYERARLEQQQRIEQGGQVVSADVYFMEQTISNACGTIGMIHCVLNNAEKLNLQEGFFKTFLEKTRNMDPSQRASSLVQSNEIEETHRTFANEGQSRPPEPEDEVDLHFVAFVEREHILYELDGRKPFPINHGPSSQGTLLEDTIKVMQRIIALEPEEKRFSMIALVPSQS